MVMCTQHIDTKIIRTREDAGEKQDQSSGAHHTAHTTCFACVPPYKIKKSQLIATRCTRFWGREGVGTNTPTIKTFLSSQAIREQHNRKNICPTGVFLCEGIVKRVFSRSFFLLHFYASTIPVFLFARPFLLLCLHTPCEVFHSDRTSEHGCMLGGGGVGGIIFAALFSTHFSDCAPTGTSTQLVSTAYFHFHTHSLHRNACRLH